MHNSIACGRWKYSFTLLLIQYCTAYKGLLCTSESSLETWCLKEQRSIFNSSTTLNAHEKVFQVYFYLRQVLLSKETHVKFQVYTYSSRKEIYTTLIEMFTLRSYVVLICSVPLLTL